MTAHEADQVKAANDSRRPTVVFIHGLWLLPSSWDRWRDVFEEAGYATVAPGWPDDPETVAEANAHPEVSPNTRPITTASGCPGTLGPWDTLVMVRQAAAHQIRQRSPN